MVGLSRPTDAARFCRSLCSKQSRRFRRRSSDTEVTMKRLLFFAIPGLLLFPLSAFAQHSQSAKKYVKHGIQRFGKGDIAGAIVEYDRALSVDPKLAEAYLNRGKAKRAGGDLDGAIADYEIACDLSPQLAASNHDITEAYLNRGYARSNRLDLDRAF